MRDNGTGTSGLPSGGGGPEQARDGAISDPGREERRETGRGNSRLAASRRVGGPEMAANREIPMTELSR